MEDWFENKREDLQEAILNAYKNANDLEQTVEYELQKNLEEIAGRNNNIRDIVFQLINRWAYPGGKLEELFLACYRRRSENPKLRELYQLYLEEKRNREEISSTNGEGDSTPERTVINVNENNSVNGITGAKNSVFCFGILVFISAVPMIISYCMLLPLSSKGLLNECYIPTGISIDLLHSLGIVGLVNFEFHKMFRKEFRQFLNIFNKNNENKTLLYTLRFLLIGAELFFAILIIYHHLDSGIINFAQLYKLEENEEALLIIKQCYLWYLPYSLINFNIVAVPIFLTLLYSQFKDTIKFQHNYDLFLKELQDLQNNVIILTTQTENIMANFRRNNMKILSRYTPTFAVFSIVAFFEQVIGGIPLTNTGKAAVIFTYICLSLTFIITWWQGLKIYENFVDNFADLLARYNLKKSEDIKITNSSYNFIKTFFDNFTISYISIIILFVSSIFSFIMPFIYKFIFPACK